MFLNILYLWYGEKEFLQHAVESWIWRILKINLHVKSTNIFCFRSMRWQRTSGSSVRVWGRNWDASHTSHLRGKWHWCSWKCTRMRPAIREMRYPTDLKLLWEGIEKSYETMWELSKRLRIHRLRTKFIDVQKANLAFRKQRKYSKSKASKMYSQQKNHFQSKDCRESIPNRIVSISKLYVRPIVRG